MLKPQSLGKVGRISLGKKNKYLEEIDKSLTQNTATWDEYSIDLLNMLLNIVLGNARHKRILKMPLIYGPYFYTSRRASGKVRDMEGGIGERVRDETLHM